MDMIHDKRKLKKKIVFCIVTITYVVVTQWNCLI